MKSKISTNFCLVRSKKRKKSTFKIESISNLNIRVADIVMIRWVRSTYFFFLSNLMVGLIGRMAKQEYFGLVIYNEGLDIYVLGQKMK